MLLCSNALFLVFGWERHSTNSSARATVETAATNPAAASSHLGPPRWKADLRKLHSFWLTNRKNIPTATNAATRVPTTNDTTQCRGLVAFDPAPFCAAPMPNQKRSLSMALRLLDFSVP
jgi:hypothetical protein